MRRSLTLILALTFAAHARAEVSLLVPLPPKPSPTAAKALIVSDLSLDRDAWLAELGKVHGVKVSAWSQGPDVNCPAEVRAKLEKEGFAIYMLSEVLDQVRQRKRRVSEELADLLGGSLTRKVALKLGPGVWVSVVPRPGIAPKDYRANWLKALGGMSQSGIGVVKCYLHREFRLPVGGVCAEVDLSAGATLGDFAKILDLAARATTSNAIRPGPTNRR